MRISKVVVRQSKRVRLSMVRARQTTAESISGLSVLPTQKKRKQPTAREQRCASCQSNTNWNRHSSEHDGSPSSPHSIEGAGRLLRNTKREHTRTTDTVRRYGYRRSSVVVSEVESCKQTRVENTLVRDGLAERRKVRTRPADSVDAAVDSSSVRPDRSSATTGGQRLSTTTGSAREPSAQFLRPNATRTKRTNCAGPGALSPASSSSAGRRRRRTSSTGGAFLRR
uniref:Uncharacterized protein n=1 Tax=Plectus sambesii TaxID=2011161 RepID=A0A914W877_9BILA